MASYQAWLIERRTAKGNNEYYIAAKGSWTTEALDATGFSCQKHAEARGRADYLTVFFIAEHQFSDFLEEDHNEG